MALNLAIDLSKKVKQQLAQQLGDLQKVYPAYSWVDQDQYHIPIHFFAPHHKKETVIQKIKDALYDQESLYLYASHLDLFMTNQIMIYVHFRREKILEAIAEKIQDAFSLEQKKFIPHITVSRSSTSSKQQYFLLQKKLDRTNIDFEFKVSELILFDSVQTIKKNSFHKIETIPLQDS